MDGTTPQTMGEMERTSELGMATGTVPGDRIDDATEAADEQDLAKRRKCIKDASDSEKALKDKLASVWSSVVDEETEAKAFAVTVDVFTGEVESLIRSGLEAYQQWESSRRESKVLTDELVAKTLEIDRLRASDESNRATIQVRMRIVPYVLSISIEKRSHRRVLFPLFNLVCATHFHFYLTLQNLLQASEAAKTEARDISRGALLAASLRGDLSATSSKLDEAMMQTEEYKRNNILLEEEIFQIRNKLSRVLQEKIKLERDQRMNLSLSKQFESASATDLDYYKLQVSELTSRLQVC